jgi:signal transduction histidine kinase
MKQITGRTLSAIAWLAISLSLGLWWTIMGLRQAADLASLQGQFQGQYQEDIIRNLDRKHRMIKMEGAFFLVLIIGGGFMLIFMSIRDEKRNQMIKDFFATVSHEMKTPLASLRLQAESLADSIKNKSQKKFIDRLISDTQRLELQMEKALYLASISRSESLFITENTIREILFSILGYYENVEFRGNPDLKMICDKKATESMIKNLVENSFNHGEASLVKIDTKEMGNWVCLEITDNGKGFKGKREHLGELFFKHTALSGSGIGLYLVSTLMQKMKGKVEFIIPKIGFTVRLFFPKEFK